MKEDSGKENIINTQNDNIDIFYFSQSDLIPNNIKEDFKKKTKFFIGFGKSKKWITTG